MTSVVLSLGANLGDRRSALARAVAALGPDKTSEVYETPPWGDDDQPHYYNIAMTAHDPDATVFDWLRRAEDCQVAAGRVRDPQRRYGPRVLDVDIIAAHDDDGEPIRCDTETLTLPHPRAHQRAFVLVPWLSIDPGAALPGRGRVRDLLRDPGLAADARTLRRVGGLSSTDHG
ncbi:MAG TPA: 2-amino-4-hydroxy-6-hydroxymethyldihydropteridine diphosphokinase [Stackebrandtia sp.]|jgi:2-amino-4-hydroxy-6-hydroxymethyldihydropteridine diphosphokinase|uniref:2-amino-4-hydroxy-6- hydroxymethyldihydropteridine diphosphokinase n=1 Tax=Stackebrandtia sp. TaxID=2023065 RepID=UPI002D6E5DA5|nr:2-amino-4-hydroxy-6-hydroxymethyldihydropteridine diphosphokinase [Stackebrandtia sp.]HZE40935.1 2-amino-4-hydroxy-6-hydroxymethyldihydropteridine diphosphokinase [Stackebrandtia sp.]